MPRKEPVEIRCSACGASFRLWIPVGMLTEWGAGEEINCIRCGERFIVKKGVDGVEVAGVEAAKVEAATKEEAEAPKAKVLFIDDDRLSIAIAESTLSEVPIRLVTASSGEDAVERFEKDEFSLVIADLHLRDPDNPESRLDGEDVLRKMVESGRNVPAIITTGKDIIDDLVLDPKWFDLNVKGFVQKGNPFWGEELKTKIKEILELD